MEYFDFNEKYKKERMIRYNKHIKQIDIKRQKISILIVSKSQYLIV